MTLLLIPIMNSMLDSSTSKPITLNFTRGAYIASTQMSGGHSASGTSPIKALAKFEESLSMDSVTIPSWQKEELLTSFLLAGWTLNIERHDWKYDCWLTKGLQYKSGIASENLFSAIESAVNAQKMG